MPRRSMRLESPQSTEEIESGPSCVSVDLRLSLETWDLDARSVTGLPRAVVVSADGDLFAGEIVSVSSARRAVTVRLA